MERGGVEFRAADKGAAGNGGEFERLQGEIPCCNDEMEVIRYAEKQIPNGLVIMAKSNTNIAQGFYYPAELESLISKEEWKELGPILAHSGPHSIVDGKSAAYYIEQVLDTAANMDVKYFRPRGLCMRLDCPGESKYTELMTVYNHAIHHVENLEEAKSRASAHGVTKAVKGTRKGWKPTKKGGSDSSLKKDTSRIETTQRKATTSLRIVLDPVSILKDPVKARAHGWPQWHIQCNAAARLAQHIDPPVVNNKPWDFSLLPARRDRWPPSKHLYYERFRGRKFLVKGQDGTEEVFIPDYDSMDQRMGFNRFSLGDVENETVVPCDEVPFEIMKHTKLYRGEPPKNDTLAEVCRPM